MDLLEDEVARTREKKKKGEKKREKEREWERESDCASLVRLYGSTRKKKRERTGFETCSRKWTPSPPPWPPRFTQLLDK